LKSNTYQENCQDYKRSITQTKTISQPHRQLW